MVLRQSRRDINLQLQEIGSLITPLAERVEGSAQAIEGARKNLNRRASLDSSQETRANLHQRLAASREDYETSTQELSELREKEAELRTALAEADQDIEAMSGQEHIGGDSDILYSELDQAQRYIETTLGGERQRAQDLRKELSRLEFNNGTLRTELDGESQHAEALLELEKTNFESELAAERGKAEGLTVKLKEAQDWVELLKQQVTDKIPPAGLEGATRHKKSHLELGDIKQALHRLAEVNGGVLVRSSGLRDPDRTLHFEEEPVLSSPHTTVEHVSPPGGPPSGPPRSVSPMTRTSMMGGSQPGFPPHGGYDQGYPPWSPHGGPPMNTRGFPGPPPPSMFGVGGPNGPGPGPHLLGTPLGWAPAVPKVPSVGWGPGGTPGLPRPLSPQPMGLPPGRAPSPQPSPMMNFRL